MVKRKRKSEDSGGLDYLTSDMSTGDYEQAGIVTGESASPSEGDMPVAEAPSKDYDGLIAETIKDVDKAYRLSRDRSVNSVLSRALTRLKDF